VKGSGQIYFTAVLEDLGPDLIPKLDGSRPVRTFWMDRRTDGHRDRATTGEPLSPAQHGTRTPDGHRDDRHPRLCRHEKSTEAERSQAGCTIEGSFRKKQQRFSGPDRLDRPLNVLQAPVGIESLDEERAESRQKQPRQKALLKLPLGEKRALDR
jgi:hypothetical protein